jgi:hypothetical protein
MIPPANYEEQAVALMAEMLDLPVRQVLLLCSPLAVTNAVQIGVEQCVGRLRAEARAKDLEQVLEFIGSVKRAQGPASHRVQGIPARRVA